MQLLGTLETCGCCEGVQPLTPVDETNRPGLNALVYRVGTHASFLSTMLARLSSHTFGKDGPPPLLALTTRDPNDPSIAFLDAWATVADVLTFYQERIANEGFLRTATERRSVLELGRLVNYTLRPGVAATAFLAYTLDKDPQKDTVVVIPKGSRAQSVPGPGELPQSFETSDDVESRFSWNNLQVRLTRPTRIISTAIPDTLYFAHTTTGLKPNDPLLLVFEQQSGGPQLVTVKSVTPDTDADRTAVIIQPGTRAFDALQKQLVQDLTDAQKQAPPGRTAEQIEALLKPLIQRVTGALSPSDLAGVIALALERLQEELAIVTARGYTNLETWIGGIVTTLQSARAGAERLLPPGAARPSIFTSPNGDLPVTLLAAGAIENPVLLGLGALLGPLKLSPSVPPPSSRDLRRSPRTLFAGNSDLAPQLLVALNPVLAPTLYTALANATFPPPASLHSTQALRLKAAPFGATAPLKPVLDSKGVVIGTEEWPLAPFVISVSLDLTAPAPSQAQVTISITRAGSTVSERLTLGASSPPQPPQTLALGSDQVEISTPGFVSVPPADFTFTFADGSTREFLVQSAAGDDGVAVITVTIEGAQWTVRPGDTSRSRVAGHDIAIDDVAGATPGASMITIVDAAPGPPAAPTNLDLDAAYDQLTPGGWIAVERADTGKPPLLTRITNIATVARADYGISGKVSRLTLADPWLTADDRFLSVVRATAVFAQSEPLELAPQPVTDDVGGASIELDDVYAGLESGRWLIVSGERTDVPATGGVQASELVMLGGVLQNVDETLPGDKVRTILKLVKPLAFTYKRTTVKIWGNVAKATHGETRAEVLGSGDGTRSLQTFALRQSPLTYVAAPNARGAASTLEVRVDGVRWHDAGSLIRLGPTEHGYITRTGDDAKTSIVFGNGIHGARLPTGIENVTGVYRTGIGKGGNVKPEQITQLQTRPLGVNAVINPLAATGGADPEDRHHARSNIPLGILTLDRLVSVEDYEDFARARAGIGKASARRLSDGQRSVVHLTIAGADDIPIDPTSDLYQNLIKALIQLGSPSQPVRVDIRDLVLLLISARVRVDADHLWQLVEPNIRATLQTIFGFDRRQLGQDVLLSEIIGAIQAVPGVVYVDVDVLHGVPEHVTPAGLRNLADQLVPPPPPRLPMRLARFDHQTYTAAAGDTLTSVAARFGLHLIELLRLNPGVTDALTAGQVLTVFRGIRPAQVAVVSPSVPDTLILTETKA